MIKSFTEAWAKNKEVLEEYLKTTNQSEYVQYEKLVELVFEKVINPELDETNRYDTNNILVIKDIGIELYLVRKANPEMPNISNYVHTHIYYGTGGDAYSLMELITDEKDVEVPPTDAALDEYMKVCHNILRRARVLSNNSVGRTKKHLFLITNENGEMNIDKIE